MYTYNANSEPQKMMLVDFQYCCWASPTIDLHYFLNTSLIEELRLNNQEVLLQFYHSELSRMLHSVQYKRHIIPTLHEFYVQFVENSFYGKFNFPISISEISGWQFKVWNSKSFPSDSMNFIYSFYGIHAHSAASNKWILWRCSFWGIFWNWWKID